MSRHNKDRRAVRDPNRHLVLSLEEQRKRCQEREELYKKQYPTAPYYNPTQDVAGDPTLKDALQPVFNPRFKSKTALIGGGWLNSLIVRAVLRVDRMMK